MDEMKNHDVKRVTLAAVVLSLLATVASAPALGQQGSRGTVRREQIELGRGMSLVTPNLFEVAVRTNMFLDLADRVGMTDEQRKQLEALLYDFQQYSVQKQADYDVADAELIRLVTRDTVDFDAVKAKVREIEALNSDVNIKKFESLLKAVRVLTHEQHMKIITIARTLQPQRRPDEERLY